MHRNTVNRDRKVRSAHYDSYDIPRTPSEGKWNSSAQSQKNEDPAKKSNLHSVTKQPSYSIEVPLGKSRTGNFVNSTGHTTEPVYERTDLHSESLPANTGNAGGSIYENAEFMRESLKRKSSSPAVLEDSPKTKRVLSKKRNVSHRVSSSGATLSQNKPKRHTPDDYEDPDGVFDETDRHYTDIATRDEDLHDTYVNPDDLRKRSAVSSRASPDDVASVSCVQGQCEYNLLFAFDFCLFVCVCVHMCLLFSGVCAYCAIIMFMHFDDPLPGI